MSYSTHSENTSLRGRYDHVGSKVHAYRMEIRKIQNERRKQKSLDTIEIPRKDKCTSRQWEIEEAKRMNAILKDMKADLVKSITEHKTRLEEITKRVAVKQGMSLSRTPLRSLSDIFLTPVRSFSDTFNKKKPIKEDIDLNESSSSVFSNCSVKDELREQESEGEMLTLLEKKEEAVKKREKVFFRKMKGFWTDFKRRIAKQRVETEIPRIRIEFGQEDMIVINLSTEQTQQFLADIQCLLELRKYLCKPYKSSK